MISNNNHYNSIINNNNDNTVIELRLATFVQLLQFGFQH